MSDAKTRQARYRAARRQAPYWQREKQSGNGMAYALMLLLFGLLLIGVGLLTMGCKPQQGSPRHGGTRAVILPVNIAACTTEDGGQDYPCRWDCATMGNRLCAPDGTRRVLFYGDASECPDPLPVGWVCEATETR